MVAKLESPPLKGSLLDVVMIYDSIPVRVRPVSLWFGADDFKSRQIWHLRAHNVESDALLDYELDRITGFVPTLASVETRAPYSKSEMKRLDTVQRETRDPRQRELPFIDAHVQDYQVGRKPPDPDRTDER